MSTRLTQGRLRQIIKEELSRVVNEMDDMPMRKIRPTLRTRLEPDSKYHFEDMINAANAISQALADLQKENKNRMNITFEINSDEVASMYGAKPEAVESLLRGASVYFSAYANPRSPGTWTINM